MYRNHVVKSGGNIDGYFFGSPHDRDVYQLIEWVVMRNQPISEVENAIINVFFKTKSVSPHSLRKYILSMVPLAERAVIAELPEKLGLLFDGWSDGSVNYVAIIGTYCAAGEYQETLISFSPLLK